MLLATFVPGSHRPQRSEEELSSVRGNRGWKREELVKRVGLAVFYASSPSSNAKVAVVMEGEGREQSEWALCHCLETL